MKLKKILQKLTVILLTIFSMPLGILAYSDYILPGGENIGIELHANGILIVGLYDVNGTSPGRDAGLRVGDKIIKVNQKNVSSILEMVNEMDGKTSLITYLRDGKERNTNLEQTKDENGVFKTGLFVKDSITGVGTLTYIDPETKLFGALGHEILEKTTGEIFEVKDGKIFESTVTGIIKSENGVPGEKNAKFNVGKILGTIRENTIHGIFGTYTSIKDRKLYKVGTKEDIKVGDAIIRTVLNGTEMKDYQIHIDKISDSNTTKNLSFTITDPTLLEQTGGIIQGMSGSPILQGEYLIGAVTHVVVESPNRGYGIFITNMLEEAEN